MTQELKFVSAPPPLLNEDLVSFKPHKFASSSNEVLAGIEYQPDRLVLLLRTLESPERYGR